MAVKIVEPHKQHLFVSSDSMTMIVEPRKRELLVSSDSKNIQPHKRNLRELRSKPHTGIFISSETDTFGPHKHVLFVSSDF